MKKDILNNKIYTFYGLSDTTLSEVCNETRKLVEEKFNIIELKLFGSYSRNEQYEDSDIDIFLMYKNKDRETAEWDTAEIMTKLNFKFACPVNIVTVPEEYKQINLCYRNIQKDGIDI